MTNLIDKLERADGPDRELDAEVFKAIGAPAPFQFMNKLIALEYNDVEQEYFARVTDDMQVRYSPPAYTASIDAAMTLVPEGWTADIRRYPDGRANADLTHWSPPCVAVRAIDAVSPAIAIVLAALRARSQGGE